MFEYFIVRHGPSIVRIPWRVINHIAIGLVLFGCVGARSKNAAVFSTLPNRLRMFPKSNWNWTDIAIMNRIFSDLHIQHTTSNNEYVLYTRLRETNHQEKDQNLVHFKLELSKHKPNAKRQLNWISVKQTWIAEHAYDHETSIKWITCTKFTSVPYILFHIWWNIGAYQAPSHPLHVIHII